MGNVGRWAVAVIGVAFALALILLVNGLLYLVWPYILLVPVAVGAAEAWSARKP